MKYVTNNGSNRSNSSLGTNEKFPLIESQSWEEKKGNKK